jgi:protein SCO1/2
MSRRLAPLGLLLLAWGGAASAVPPHHGHEHVMAAAGSHGAASTAPSKTIAAERASAGNGHAGMSHDSDPHAHHRAMMHKRSYQRSEHDYALADLPLLDKDGRETSLLAELNTGEPVILTFVFTTCTTICPVLSGTFSQLQGTLGEDIGGLRMVSVSIDPEYDTPERLRAYAERFDAGPQWQFLTGRLGDIVAVQKAFDVYRGNKMSHEPTILLRKSEDAPWVRMDGLASAADVAEEYQRLMGAGPDSEG